MEMSFNVSDVPLLSFSKSIFVFGGVCWITSGWGDESHAYGQTRYQIGKMLSAAVMEMTMKITMKMAMRITMVLVRFLESGL